MAPTNIFCSPYTEELAAANMALALYQSEITLDLSSDPANGAINRSADGSRFEVAFDQPVGLPRDARLAHAEVINATVVWTVPNVITGENDTFYVTGPDTLDVTTPYVVTIPQGLYPPSDLAQAILADLADQGAKTTPNNLLTFIEDVPTQRMKIVLNYDDVAVDFTPANTPRELLGFNSAVIGPPGVGNAPQTFVGDNPAKFNVVSSFKINTNLINQGARVNNAYSNAIATVLIDKAPGSTLVHRPFNPPRFPADELVGARRTRAMFWLTDQTLTPVNTAGEFWDFTLKLSYLLPATL